MEEKHIKCSPDQSASTCGIDEINRLAANVAEQEYRVEAIDQQDDALEPVVVNSECLESMVPTGNALDSNRPCISKAVESFKKHKIILMEFLHDQASYCAVSRSTTLELERQGHHHTLRNVEALPAVETDSALGNALENHLRSYAFLESTVECTRSLYENLVKDHGERENQLFQRISYLEQRNQQLVAENEALGTAIHFAEERMQQAESKMGEICEAQRAMQGVLLDITSARIEATRLVESIDSQLQQLHNQKERLEAQHEMQSFIIKELQRHTKPAHAPYVVNPAHLTEAKIICAEADKPRISTTRGGIIEPITKQLADSQLLVVSLLQRIDELGKKQKQ